MTLFMRDKEQQRFGEMKKSVEMIRDNQNDTEERVSDEKMRRMAKLSVVDYNKIIYFIDNNPEWNDEDIAETVINSSNE